MVAAYPLGGVVFEELRGFSFVFYYRSDPLHHIAVCHRRSAEFANFNHN